MAAPSFLQMIAGAASDLANAATGTLRLFMDTATGLPAVKDDAGTVTSLSITGATGPGYTATSATSFTPGTGSKAFTTQAGLAYTAGARVRASSAAGPTTTYMEGVVTAYTGTTLTVTIDLFAGTGAHTDWDLNLAGDQGIQGAGVPPTVVAHGAMGAAETFDYSAGPAHSGTVNAALAVTLTGWTSGSECILSLYLTTDGTGGYGPPTFGAEVVNSADLVWDDAAAAFNVIRLFTVDNGTTVYIATDAIPTLDAVIAVSSGEDIADALSGAASPAAGNVFATMADVTGAGGFSPDVHMPRVISINAPDGSKSNVNFDTVNASTGEYVVLFSSGAQNDEVVWEVALSAGTWSVFLEFHRYSSRGIATVYFDASSVGTIDMYGSDTAPVRGSITGITVAATALVALKIKMATKNGSSSGYGAWLRTVQLIRTA